MADNGASPVPYPDDIALSPFHKIRHPKKRALLAAYAECATITGAVEIAQCDRTMHYHWMKHDPDYVEAFHLAHEMAIDAHEDEASRRALGWDEERYTDSGERYVIRKYSDTMLIFRLKALRPDKYRDNPRKDERHDISDLLKAVLLELADRHTLPTPVHDAEWAPLPPRERTNGQDRRALPEPPGIDEEG